MYCRLRGRETVLCNTLHWDSGAVELVKVQTRHLLCGLAHWLCWCKMKGVLESTLPFARPTRQRVLQGSHLSKLNLLANLDGAEVHHTILREAHDHPPGFGHRMHTDPCLGYLSVVAFWFYEDGPDGQSELLRPSGDVRFLWGARPLSFCDSMALE
jgi:hypothetical protein